MVALIYAPWARGCLQPWAIKVLAGLISLAGVFWLLAILRAGGTRVSVFCLICTLALLVQGWWMVFNAHSIYDAGHDKFNFVPSLWPAGPGAVDQRVAAASMLQMTSVLIAFLIASDLAASKIWRWRFLGAIAWTGFTIAAYGILQRVGHLPPLAHSKYPQSVFASFDYHGNAGAFLNMVIPAVFVLALARPFSKPAKTVSVGGIIGLTVCVAAVLVNISRAAMVISLAVLAALVVWARKFRPGHLRLGAMARRPITAVILLFVIAIAGAGSRELWRRWRYLPTSLEWDNPRILMDRIAYHMAGDAGWFGQGPGSFKLLLPSTPYMIPALYSRWEVLVFKPGDEISRDSYVHNDYLQFAIEWGWIGSTLWGCLVLGGVWNGLSAYRRADAADQRLLLAASLIALGGVLTHAMVDWPLQVASLELYAAVYLAILWSSVKACASC
jgi:O-antigen ligase